MSYWDRTEEQWGRAREHHHAAGSRWMQTGPSEAVEDPDDAAWAAGNLWVGMRVIAGDSVGLHLVREPFDGYVYCVGADTQYHHGVVGYERVPAELLDESIVTDANGEAST